MAVGSHAFWNTTVGRFTLSTTTTGYCETPPGIAIPGAASDPPAPTQFVPANLRARMLFSLVVPPCHVTHTVPLGETPMDGDDGNRFDDALMPGNVCEPPNALQLPV